MENQPAQSIKVIEDDDEDKAFVVIKVRENLRKVLSGTVGDDVGSEQTSKPSIYKIPEFMREVKPKAFQPLLVSFGPYHHGKPHLAPLELKKLQVFHQFLTGCGLDVGFIVERVWSMLKELQGSYDMLEDEWKVDTERFLQLMVVDGCFILEFLYHCPRWLRNIRPEIKRDMLLLENQLPTKLLDKLCSMTNIKELVVQDVESHFCHRMLFIPEDVETRQYLHILDMYRAVLLYPRTKRKDQNRSGSGSGKSDKFNPADHQIIRQATQLREAGIKFEKSKTKSLTDVSFEGGVLRLPWMLLDDGTEPAFLNVMAFEKLHIGAGKKVASFVYLVDNLIDVVKEKVEEEDRRKLCDTSSILEASI